MKKINIEINPLPLREKIYVDCNIQDFIVKKIHAEKYDKVFFIVDKHVYEKQKNYIGWLVEKTGACGILFLKPKPNYKDFKHCEYLFKKLLTYGINRKSCLVAVGGGFVADITGFLASIFMRGIDFIQIPTTMMSMSDAVIGKVAVNFDRSKNLLGSFYFPKFVFVDTNFLKTLQKQELILGLVEVWKHALLVQDYKIIKKMEDFLTGSSNFDEAKIIKFSMEVKKNSSKWIMLIH